VGDTDWLLFFWKGEREFGVVRLEPVVDVELNVDIDWVIIVDLLYQTSLIH
jgi:hypothetical protein